MDFSHERKYYFSISVFGRLLGPLARRCKNGNTRPGGMVGPEGRRRVEEDERGLRWGRWTRRREKGGWGDS